MPTITSYTTKCDLTPDMARTIISPRILHVSQGFTLHALPDHDPPPV